MYEAAKLAGYLLSPLTVVLGLFVAAALCRWSGSHRWAAALALTAFAGLWAASTPWIAQTLKHELEARYPALAPEATPSADALVVLGGALSTGAGPQRPSFGMGRSASRVWHAAALYAAGKAKWVVVAAGNQPGEEHFQTEADAIAEMLLRLGVPRTAIRLDGTSRNTRENAVQAGAVVKRLGARTILLVTSAVHMPRAIKTFNKEWQGSGIALIPAATDFSAHHNRGAPQLWFPTASALSDVTSTVKEFAGLIALDMM